ncbi:SHOCT domain-containing protein [Kribbella monticola]|uniref:SHOCT domain-containing protein n=1 Tax=Kribbella monticola TaxID=2185285 RepID=UPI0013001D95|nr:SHOCT domain-containing protein [Kribbella monticola]
MMHGQGADIGLLLAALTLWAATVGGAVWAGMRIVHRPQPRPPTLPSPLDLLERRYAAGKITQDAFDEARARLREHELDR